MPNTKNIKQRIRSISSTLQVTKALELISSIKMRHSLNAMLPAREFARNVSTLSNMLQDAEEDLNTKLWPYKSNNAKKILLIIIASDRGLAGALNTNIIKQVQKTVTQLPDYEFDAVCIGKKAAKATVVVQNINLLNLFKHNETSYDFFLANPLTQIALDGFKNKKYAKAIVIYTDYINTLKQAPKSLQILPIEPAEITKDDSQDTQNTKEIYDYIIEPEKQEILETLGRLTARVNIYQALLEGTASEHAARMIAMKNATENGYELVKDLSFTYNKLRQQSITAEIAEVSAGSIALQNT